MHLNITSIRNLHYLHAILLNLRKINGNTAYNFPEQLVSASVLFSPSVGLDTI